MWDSNRRPSFVGRQQGSMVRNRGHENVRECRLGVRIRTNTYEVCPTGNIAVGSGMGRRGVKCQAPCPLTLLSSRQSTCLLHMVWLPCIVPSQHDTYLSPTSTGAERLRRQVSEDGRKEASSRNVEAENDFLCHRHGVRIRFSSVRFCHATDCCACNGAVVMQSESRSQDDIQTLHDGETLIMRT